MQNLPKKIRVTFLMIMLALMASMIVRGMLIPQQFSSPSNKLIVAACKSIKGCRTAEIGVVPSQFIPTPVIYIHMAAHSKTSLNEMRPVFDRAMSERYETLNHFQKWTQWKYQYEVKYDGK
jgi:hypothetical protein